MKKQIKQVYNPYLPSYEYIPDGEPHVFDDRLYVFGSHDRFNGTQFCMNNYMCYSTPVDDLSDWICHGVMYKKEQDPYCKDDNIMLAPDVVQGNDGKFYLYYSLGLIPFVSVAVSDRPEGPYEYYGVVKWADGTFAGMKDHDIFMFDPGVFRDEDGKIYLYTGFGPEEDGFLADACARFQMDGAYAFRVADDMLTIEENFGCMIPKKKYATDTSFEGHAFFEASSMRKINGKYCFVYSSELSHELCYAVSDSPVENFTYGGILVSNGDVGLNGNKIRKNYTGNTHGSLVEVDNQWYIFYHRQTNRHSYSRQACAEKIMLDSEGKFHQAEITSCGLNVGSLSGIGTYPASIACHLWSKDGAVHYEVGEKLKLPEHPFFTQSGVDREENEDQHIANLCDGAVCGFKYFDLTDTREIIVEIEAQGEAEVHGQLEVCTNENFEEKNILAKMPIQIVADDKGRQNIGGEINKISGVQALYFRYIGSGCINFYNFTVGRR